jgi:hypothetical protein
MVGLRIWNNNSKVPCTYLAKLTLGYLYLKLFKMGNIIIKTKYCACTQSGLDSGIQPETTSPHRDRYFCPIKSGINQ